ncbi:thioredoxin family protein [Candidatus Aerophobetes bacterium]|uniref:Thioredoxin family protein n=1 Tax=Aerophobetes bacterium TaxID=2030807 RepID=A0A523QGC9_UNCAE|nr:MAG: thioredoxin family protein [Candidatus Aerophobetes bacterium]
MKVQIFGIGCPRCKKLEANARKAVEEIGIEAEIKKVQDIKEISKFGVMMTPALAIDGKVKCSGEIAPVEKIKKWLQAVE